MGGLDRLIEMYEDLGCTLEDLACAREIVKTLCSFTDKDRMSPPPSSLIFFQS